MDIGTIIIIGSLVYILIYPITVIISDIRMYKKNDHQTFRKG